MIPAVWRVCSLSSRQSGEVGRLEFQRGAPPVSPRPHPASDHPRSEDCTLAQHLLPQQRPQLEHAQPPLTPQQLQHLHRQQNHQQHQHLQHQHRHQQSPPPPPPRAEPAAFLMQATTRLLLQPELKAQTTAPLEAVALYGSIGASAGVGDEGHRSPCATLLQQETLQQWLVSGVPAGPPRLEASDTASIADRCDRLPAPPPSAARADAFRPEGSDPVCVQQWCPAKLHHLFICIDQFRSELMACKVLMSARSKIPGP